jgi:hypothetical protein
VLGFLLAACAGSTAPPSTVAAPDPQPDAKQIVTSDIRAIFSEPETVRVLAISTPKPVKHSRLGDVWRVCLNADVRKGVVGDRPLGLRTFAVFFRAGKIAERRVAIPEDMCSGEGYEPFTVTTLPPRVKRAKELNAERAKKKGAAPPTPAPVTR